jgi:hypothetical protein
MLTCHFGVRSLLWIVVGGALLTSGNAACSVLTSLDGLTGGEQAEAGSDPNGGDGAGGPSSGDGGGPGATDGRPPGTAADGGGSITDASAFDATNGGSDSGPPGTKDSGAGSDTGSGPLPDTGPPSPFAGLVQIDVSSILTANTVATTQKPNSGAPIVWADGFFGQHDFATNAEITALMPGAGYVGLPDTGHFAGNGATIPPAQLAWNNSINNDNSVLLQNPFADAGVANSLTFAVPSARYQQLQIYVTATHGSAGVGSNLGVSVVYADKTSTASTVMVPAWDTNAATLDAGPAEHVLVSGVSAMDPTARTVSTGFTVSIFAIDLDPNPLKSLVRVTLVDRGGDPTQYAFETVLFYGATGW